MRTIHAVLFLLTVMPGLLFAQDAKLDIGAGNDNLSPNKGSYKYTSVTGLFSVQMPSGCAKVRERSQGDENAALMMDDEDLGDAGGLITEVSCDRNGEKGEGCAVTSLINMTDGHGGPPGPDQVKERLLKVLNGFGAQVVSQRPIARVFEEEGLRAEGLEVRAAQPNGPGQLWLRGLVSGRNVFILAAWRIQGGLDDDPQYAAFFNSFTPLAP